MSSGIEIVLCPYCEEECSLDCEGECRIAMLLIEQEGADFICWYFQCPNCNYQEAWELENETS